jgi:GDPmannose 4,6-dehydratase
VESLLGDPSKAKELLGWTPEISAQEMCSEMVRADLVEAKKIALLEANGFKSRLAAE